MFITSFKGIIEQRKTFEYSITSSSIESINFYRISLSCIPITKRYDVTAIGKNLLKISFGNSISTCIFLFADRASAILIKSIKMGAQA